MLIGFQLLVVSSVEMIDAGQWCLNFKAEVVKSIGNTLMMSSMVEGIHKEQGEISNNFQ